MRFCVLPKNMTLPRPSTQTAQSRVEHTNHDFFSFAGGGGGGGGGLLHML